MRRQMMPAEIKRLRNGSMVTIKTRKPTETVEAQYRKQGGWLIHRLIHREGCIWLR